jgi:hypothetical protein
MLAVLIKRTARKAFDGWEKIWVQDVVAQDFYEYPYASKWVGMNMLSIDENTVVIDAAQTQLIKGFRTCRYHKYSINLATQPYIRW